MSLQGTVRTPASGLWSALSRHEGALWGIVAASLVADLLLTYYGVENGLTESNPVARVGFERFGYAALGALKLFALGVGVACRPLLPRAYTAVVPIGLAIPWVAAALINAVVIGTTLR